MFEMGLGCNMGTCVAGGMRLFRAFLPNVEYHAFEFQMRLCRARFHNSSMSEDDIAYIESHHCTGSSGNPSDLQKCAEKFGPFDIIIDDASHQVAHVMAAYRYWFPSKYLNYGGVYVMEDLQTHFAGLYTGRHRRYSMGIHVGALLQWKMAVNRESGKVWEGSPAATHVPELPYLAWITQSVHCGPEICAFEKVTKLEEPLPEGFPEEWKQ